MPAPTTRTWSSGAGTTRTALAVLAAADEAIRLADALPNIDFIMSFAIPHEIDPMRAFVESFAAMAANSIKPIVNIADDRSELTAIWEITKVLRGGAWTTRGRMIRNTWRTYYGPERNDVFAGFRTCAL